eukprot:Colp12_sorted_trinity150504_noHs@14332
MFGQFFRRALPNMGMAALSRAAFVPQASRSAFFVLPVSLKTCTSSFHSSTALASKMRIVAPPKRLSKKPRLTKEEKIEVKEKVLNIKYSPKKLNLIAKQIRNLTVENAMLQMKYSHKKAASSVSHALSLAKSHASHNYNLDNSKLYVSECYVGRGTHLKRIKIQARGRFGRMKRYRSHLFLKVKQGEPKKKKTPKEKRYHYLTKATLNPRVKPIATAL